MLSPDTTIHGRYRVVYAVDERPDAQLYRARDEQSGKLVLLGVLPFANDAQRSDFELGARQLATLQHDALLPLLEHFAEGSSYYLVCADAGGQDLERTLRGSGGPLAEVTVLAQATNLLDLLDFLHTQRPPIYLGDPQPTDVWVAEGGDWRLVPLTLLRPIGQVATAYRAPELADANAEPGTASDTYAFSALLYHALCGWAPPNAEQRQAGTPLNSPRALNPALSPLAEQALLRGLQLLAKNRYQHARELRLALETVKMMSGRSLGLGPDVLANPQSPAPTAPPSVPAPPVVPPYPAGQPAYPQPAPPAAPAYPPAQPGYPPVTGPTAQLGYPSAQVYQQPYPAPVAPKRGLSTGCLVALAVVLTLIGIAIAAGLFLVLVGRSLSLPFGAGALPFATVAPQAVAPTAIAPTTVPATAAPVATAEPTLVPANLGPNPITLGNAAQITRTLEITSDVAGPVAFSPDGSKIAIGISNYISLRPADLRGNGNDLRGHTGLVGSLAWSPDGKQLATGAINDNTIRIWDAQTNTLLRELKGHASWIRSLAWSPDGKMLASGSVDLSIRLWDPASGTELKALNGHTGILGGLAFSPDSSLLASAARDGTVRLWNVASGTEQAGFSFSTPLDPANNLRVWTTGVAFSNDGKQIAVGAIDGIVRLLDATTGNEQRQLSGHSDWVVIRGVAYAPDGKTLYTGGFDGTIRAWNPQTGQELSQFRGHQLRIAGFSISPDGQRLVSTSSEDGGVYLWNTADQTRLGILRIGQGLITALTYAPDSSAVGSAGFNGTLQIYRLNQQRGQLLLGSATTTQPLAFLESDKIVTISDQGSLVVLSAGQSSGLVLSGLNGAPLSVVASRDGALVVAGSSSGAIALWDATKAEPIRTLQSQFSAIYTLALNSDASLLAVAGPPDSPQVEIWDVASGQRLQTLSGPTGGITGVAFQPRGSLLAASDRAGGLRVWQARDGKLLRTVQADSSLQRFVGVAFSPDGTMLAGAAITGELIFWDAGSGIEAARLAIPQGSPVALAFSPDGQQLAVSVRNETLPIYLFGVPTQ